jgi:hypothetical protein
VAVALQRAGLTDARLSDWLSEGLDAKEIERFA